MSYIHPYSVGREEKPLAWLSSGSANVAFHFMCWGLAQSEETPGVMWEFLGALSLCSACFYWFPLAPHSLESLCNKLHWYYWCMGTAEATTQILIGRVLGWNGFVLRINNKKLADAQIQTCCFPVFFYFIFFLQLLEEMYCIKLYLTKYNKNVLINYFIFFSKCLNVLFYYHFRLILNFFHPLPSLCTCSAIRNLLMKPFN